MPSPFPGMDPYLEDFWGDIHARLVLYACDQVQTSLPRDLRARVEERVYVDSPDTGSRDVYPDVRIVERVRGRGGLAVTTPTLVADQPLIVRLESEPMTETYIEIIDIGSGRRVVTVIEVLSPANKRPGAGQRQYLRKQREVLKARANLVEIDLLREGQRVVSVPEDRIRRTHRTPYRVMVRRGWKPKDAEVYAVPLRERLPTISIPLRETDPDVKLDWQAVLNRAYENGGYADDVNYEAEPEAPLSEADATWADGLLRESGHRSSQAPRRKRRRTE